MTVDRFAPETVHDDVIVGPRRFDPYRRISRYREKDRFHDYDADRERSAPQYSNMKKKFHRIQRSEDSQHRVSSSSSFSYTSSTVALDLSSSSSSSFDCDENTRPQSHRHRQMREHLSVLSPTSLTDDSVVTISDSVNKSPYHSLLDNMKSFTSFDDDNDTIQQMKNSTKQFQSQSSMHNLQGSDVNTDAQPLSSFFSSYKFTPFSTKYAPESLSKLGQALGNIMNASELQKSDENVFDERYCCNRDHHSSSQREQDKRSDTSKFVLKSLTCPIADKQGSTSMGASHGRRRDCNRFWSQPFICLSSHSLFAVDDDESVTRK